MFAKKIPTLIGLILLLVGAVAGVVFVSQETDFLPRAAPEYIPREVKLTNISDTSFTVSWVTREPTIGFIQYGVGENDLSELAVDERDQLTGSSGSYRTHYVTLQGLSPQQLYYYKLGSQGKQLYDNDGQAFSTSTAPTLTTPSELDTAYGSVLTPAQTPAEGAIVYLMLPNSAPLSALVKQDGNWTITMSMARTANLQQYASYDAQSALINLLVRASEDQTSQVTALAGNARPLPNLSIGQVYDFTDQTTSGNSPVPIVEESKFSIQSFEVTEPGDQGDIVILTLPQDGVILDTARPVFEGTAPSGSVLTLGVHGAKILTGSVAVSTDGTWDWTPGSDLLAGVHVFSANFTDDEGVFHSVTRSFTIASNIEGTAELPTYSATPSATLTPTVSLSPSPDPSPSPTETVRVSYPSSPSATPVAGESTPTILLALSGLIFIFVGFFLHSSFFRTVKGRND